MQCLFLDHSGTEPETKNSLHLRLLMEKELRSHDPSDSLTEKMLKKLLWIC